MGRRILVDVLLGAVLAFGSQVIQYGAYALGLALGLAFPYESAPVDPGAQAGWVWQISTMSLIAAVPVLVLTFGVAWLLKTASLADGLRQGAVWAAVVIVWHLGIGALNGTLALFGAFGVWVYFLAFALGPIAAGWLRGRR